MTKSNNKKSVNKEKENYNNDVINLVIARLQSFPPNVSISIGGDTRSESLKIDKIIEHIKARDEIGKKMIEIQLAYIRSFKSSKPYASIGN